MRNGSEPRETTLGSRPCGRTSLTQLRPPPQPLPRKRIGAGEVFLWEDGEPRAMASRVRPTRQSIAVNGVYTPPGLRGHGYATACVAALSRRLLDEGSRCCVLFTDLANPTSNSIYARIGYRPVCDFALYRFGEG